MSELFNLSQFAPYPDSTGEEYMNENQVSHFKNVLLKWKHSLVENVGQMTRNFTGQPAVCADPVDQSSHITEINNEVIKQTRQTELIHKIDATLQRIQDEDYGYCDSCGTEIGLRRLEARPTANLCIDCKSALEVKAKAFAH